MSRLIPQFWSRRCEAAWLHAPSRVLVHIVTEDILIAQSEDVDIGLPREAIGFLVKKDTVFITWLLF
jgi:hypothetical protein